MRTRGLTRRGWKLFSGIMVIVAGCTGIVEAVRLDADPRPPRERGEERSRPPTAPPMDNLVSLDFDNVELKVVIKYISEITGQNFLVDDKVRGRVTLISPSKIPVSELRRVLDSLLELHGFTAVPSGNLTKIVPLREVKQKGVETDVGRDPRDIPQTDRMIT